MFFFFSCIQLAVAHRSLWFVFAISTIHKLSVVTKLNFTVTNYGHKQLNWNQKHFHAGCHNYLAIYVHLQKSDGHGFIWSSPIQGYGWSLKHVSVRRRVLVRKIISVVRF